MQDSGFHRQVSDGFGGLDPFQRQLTGESITSGANPLAAFPNDHGYGGAARWSAPQQEDYIAELRTKVNNADWASLYAYGCTRALASPSWSASEERCDRLAMLAKGAKRILEIGSFCGVAALTMAEAMPAEGRILVLEFDPFMVDFGIDVKAKSESFEKVNYMVGAARESLKTLAGRVQDEDWEPFDLAVIDADKAGVVDYFEILADTPGFMRGSCTICVDTTPFKGQLFQNYVKHGKPDEYICSSFQTEINNLRKYAKSSGAFEVNEAACLLYAQRKISDKHNSKTSGANPLSAFPNDYIRRSAKDLQSWAAPIQEDLVEDLRNEVYQTDWNALFLDGSTQARVEPFWCASAERCKQLQDLCKTTSARRVLEIGTFCGAGALSMAEVLPENCEIVALELDPFVAEFGWEIKDKSAAWRKVSLKIGQARDSLQELASQVDDTRTAWIPFDLVVIDADKAAMLEYFRFLWETPNMLAESATICVDATPFRKQLYVQYVKEKMDKPGDWVVKSGQDSIDAFLDHVKSIPELDFSENSGFATIRKRK